MRSRRLFVRAGRLAGLGLFTGALFLLSPAPFAADYPGVALTLRLAGVALVVLGIASLVIAIKIRGRIHDGTDR